MEEQYLTSESNRETWNPTPFALFGILLAVFLSYDFYAYFLPPIVSILMTWLFGLMILGLAVFSVRHALMLLILALVFSDDISRYHDEILKGREVYNLLTVPFAGIAVGNHITLGMIALAMLFLVLRTIRKPEAEEFSLIDLSVSVVALLYILAILHGIGNAFNNLRGMINDLALPIMVCGMYFVTRNFIRQPSDMLALWKFLIYATGAKVFIWTCYYFAGIGYDFGATLRVGFGSGWILFILLLLHGVILQQKSIPVRRSERWLAGFLGLLAGGLILTGAGRMIWVLTGFALPLVILLSDFRAKLRLLPLAGIGGMVLITLLVQVRPEMFNTIKGLASTLRFWDAGTFESSESNVVRVYEFLNVHGQILDHNNLILGDGPGSFFTDRYYPFPVGLRVNADYTLQEIIARRFQNTHSLVSSLMLNIGYGGTLVFLGAMFLILTRCWQLARRAADPYLRMIGLAMFAFLPPMVYMCWSPLTYMLLGIFIGIIDRAYRFEFISEAGQEGMLEPLAAAAEAS